MRRPRVRCLQYVDARLVVCTCFDLPLGLAKLATAEMHEEGAIAQVSRFRCQNDILRTAPAVTDLDPTRHEAWLLITCLERLRFSTCIPTYRPNIPSVYSIAPSSSATGHSQKHSDNSSSCRKRWTT